MKHKSAPNKDVRFEPAFTYPIFGDEETVFGYRSLRMKLDFACDTLQPSFTSSYESAYPTTAETKPDDLEELLKDFIPGEQTARMWAHHCLIHILQPRLTRLQPPRHQTRPSNRQANW